MTDNVWLQCLLCRAYHQTPAVALTHQASDPTRCGEATYTVFAVRDVVPPDVDAEGAALRAQWAAEIEAHIARLAQGPLLSPEQRARLADQLRRPAQALDQIGGQADG